MTRTADTVPAPIGVAATVVLLRDGAGGPEVLLLERPRHRGSFAGAWVFPGGGVDPEDSVPTDAAAPSPDAASHPDAAEELAARRAAVREVREETGLEVSPGSLVCTALWIPPASAPKRLRTWFYLTAAPAGAIVLAEDEVIDYAWLRPEAALERHASAALMLVAPTWVTLHGLCGFGSVAGIIASAARRGRARYETRLGASGSGPTLFWAGDVAYDDEALAEHAGGRHRLEIGDPPWVYSRSGPD
ncbi:NUDIX hydrolase [Cryobacterium roopkundense]|uniref:8-oxo-dGTP pyrophosphatase MutT (NUDIX family) n=1 Tax=Cryobacterium roopkundense TaxID=1001240 RepID=A0A7W8ZZ61_9MICO|nr:NUDIX hydrolase [Cryobacterium roopkundense]MBB5642650.1 8-oxo-dGTP pyrophosphatase MutT (NUDIX family) [Cryobacterium roopkundense]